MTDICNEGNKYIDCQKVLKKTQNSLNLTPIINQLIKREVDIQRTEEETEEDRILSFILRLHSKNASQCKSRLKTYCEFTKRINLGLNNVDPKIKKICSSSDQDERCNKLRRYIGRLSLQLNKDINKELKEIQKNNKSLTDDECTKYQIDCMLLEGTYPDLVSIICSTLIINCYEKKLKNLAKKILFRGLRGNLKNTNTCEQKIEMTCIKLSKERDELVEICLNQKEICQDLVKTAKKNCEDLEKKIEIANKNLNNEKCHSLFKECYFYEPNCENLNVHNCEELIKKCESKGITYLPFVRSFSPIEPQVTLGEEIGLDELYKSAEFEEIYTGKPEKKMPLYMLPLLIRSSKLDPDDYDEDEICENELKEKCNFLENLRSDMESLCKNDKKKSCEKISQLSEKCNDLKKELYNKDLSSTETSKSSKFFSWTRLPKLLTRKECTHLLSECFYLETQCVENLNLTCRNVKIACYRKGRIIKTNKILQKRLRGMLHSLDDYTNFKKCQIKLMEECKTLKNKNDVFFFLCLESMYTCLTLWEDIQAKEANLFQILGRKRDAPTNQECSELQKLCKELESDSELIHKPCSTLKRHCIFRNNSIQLKNYLLKKKEDSFSSITQCRKILKKECNKLFKKGENPFNYSCIKQEESCDLMRLEVIKHCTALKNNIETLNILNTITQDNEELCMLWGGYCEQLSPNCNELLEKTEKNQGLCTQLKNKCKLFFQRRDMEDALIYEFEGSLSSSESCVTMLNEYCSKKENMNSIVTVNPCKNSTNNHEEYRKVLCSKLVNRIKEQCPKLSNETMKVYKNLEEKQREFENIKKEAKKAMEEAKVILSTHEKTNNTLRNNIISNISKPLIERPNKRTSTIRFKLIKREDIKAQVAKKEGIAFDLVAHMFDIYLDLKEICNHLSEDCKFKKECDYELLCKKMRSICTGLELLEITPQVTKTITQNITITEKTTTTKTMIIIEETKSTKIKEKTFTKKKVCTSIFTTNIQITHTSTHTSTSTQTSIHTNISTQISTVTSTVMSTKLCNLTEYITMTQNELENLKPSEGLRIDGWNIIKRILLTIIISTMI
ncbi:uncharacterized protein T551_02773 [Pneumocystis jirovecii RU7]|uniref:Major surface glycoprotein 2 C-terminal domain-containing protein n=1 Tax=Pneumocystis jirovecii (strain RU7) TaxID=1408657 RepID=A0A0W4ZIZ5_PNEJ7|nr:uncharacterized protein T551_02773 [Pneumocystis jirovecii RU7]KTW28354.1 hypothetical protein T551_02773 [Pneumocystis jirovecii RU7]